MLRKPVTILVLFLVNAAAVSAADEPLHTGRRLRDELAAPISGTRNAVPLREMLTRLGEDRRVAILLDRRVDPSTSVDLQVVNRPLSEAIDELARQAGCGTAVIGSTVFVAPEEVAAMVRTLVALRQTELQQLEGRSASRRLFALTNSRTIEWPILAHPRDIVQMIGERFELQIDGIERVPYDVWAAGTMAGVSAAESLTLILLQFDLTFRWSADAASVQLERLPESVLIERSHRPRAQRMPEALRQVANLLPHRDPTVDAGRIVLSATVEEHEQVDRLLQGKSPRNPQTPDTMQVPLRRREFTLTVVRKPAIALIRTLEAQGIDVQYDADELATAGIDLTQLISLELSRADVDEFCTAWCDPLGLDYEINGTTISLAPK